MENKIAQIKKLIKDLNYHRDLYYNQNKIEISDKEYDELFDELERLENETGVRFSNSPTQSVGYESVSKLEKVKHSHPLLSLGKTTDLDEFVKYFQGKDVLLMAKLDGLTCSLFYQNKKMQRAESRGNGEVGENITHNAKVFSNLPLAITSDSDFTIDGECIITYDEFDKINQRENTEYKNPRNLVSGSVRQLNSEVAKKRNIKFIAWKLPNITLRDGTEFPVFRHSESFQWLKDYGFEVVPHILVKNGDKQAFESAIREIEKICETEGIPIDGIVGMFDDAQYGESLGYTGHHPRHSLAYKFYQEENKTTLLDIEWSTSRTGLVNPVAVFEPVEIDGTTVSRATLNNVSIIKELELGIGDEISVIKANQIIPKVVENYTRSNTYKLPTTCPGCGEPVIIKNDNGREMMYCENRKCGAVVHDKIANFASRNAMNIVGISEERLWDLMNYGYVTDFESIYNLADHRGEIAVIAGFGENIVENLLQAINDSKKCTLQNVIIAIGIPNIGKSAAYTITEYVESVANGSNLLEEFIDRATHGEDWSKLTAIGETTSNVINRYVWDNLHEIEPLLKYLDVQPMKSSPTSQKLGGKSFCITGKLEKFANRNALIECIVENGGIVVSSVTAKTDYLITNDKDSGSSKNKKAEKFGTQIISEDEFLSLVN